MSQETNETPLKIVSLTAENVKRLRAVTITPDGNLVVIGGRNAQGKSSVLDSIAMAIGGTKLMPEKPIRDGASHASIELDLGEIKVTRTFTAKGTSLVVTSSDDVKLPSPQAVLDKLTSKVSFDPLDFLKMDATKQFDTMRRLVGIDFAPLDQQRATLYAERTGVNREVSTQQIRLNAMRKHDDAPAELIDAHALLAAVEAAEVENRSNAEKRAAIPEWENDIAETKANIERLTRELETAKEAMKQFVAGLDKAKKEIAELQDRDVAGLRAKLAEADTINQKVRENAAHAQETKTLAELASKAKKLTQQIEDIDEQKAKAIRDAKFPIDGLSFDDTGVIYNGVPFSQASNAEQLRVSVAVGIAMNPRLKMLLVRDGSLLDADNLKLLAELAQEHDAQIFLERVGKGAECSVIIEDGRVEEQPEGDAK